MHPHAPSNNQPIKVLNTRSILDAAEDGRPLTPAEATHLLGLRKEEDLRRLRQVADTVRQRQVGETVFYEVGLSLFLTNRCEMAPLLYPYPRQAGDEGAFTVTRDDVDALLEQAISGEYKRLSVSGGGFYALLQIPGLEASTVLKSYGKLIGYLHEHAPLLRIHGFSPDEIEFLSVLSDRNARYVLEYLKDHGLRQLESYGCDVLVDSVRQGLSPKKASVKRWMEIVHTARKLDFPVTARLEAGPVETLAQRVAHMERLRNALLRHPGLFPVLIPQLWPRAPHQSMPTPSIQSISHTHRLVLTAVLRLYLGEVLPHQQAIWIPGHAREAQEAIEWGANHIGSTDATAYYSFLADSRSKESPSVSDLQALIAETGRSSAAFRST